jgi:hypothetical protein
MDMDVRRIYIVDWNSDYQAFILYPSDHFVNTQWPAHKRDKAYLLYF